MVLYYLTLPFADKTIDQYITLILIVANTATMPLIIRKCGIKKRNIEDPEVNSSYSSISILIVRIMKVTAVLTII
jgi:hypothetical protein